MTQAYEQYLAHYGIKGQKHGNRRFQNEDGSLTEAGKIRYGIGKGHGQKKDVPESDTWKKKESKYLSDDELNRRNNRMMREAQYKQNIDNRHPVRKEAKAALKKVFWGTLVAVATAAMVANYKTAMNKGSEFLESANAKHYLTKKVGRGAEWLM